MLFLRILGELKKETSFALLAYCLMGNHFHLAIKVGEVPLSRILQRLLTRYASAYNARHDRTGHLFQDRYKAILCLNERYLLRLVSYIHANPIRSGLVAQEADWPWSSCGAYSGTRPTPLVDPIDLSSTLGLVDATGTNPDEFDPWPQMAGRPAPVLLRKLPKDQASLDALAKNASVTTGVPIDVLRSGRRDPLAVQAKRAFVARCLRHGHSLTSISRWLCCSPSSAHNLAYGREFSKESKA